MNQTLNEIDKKLAEWEDFFKGDMADEVTELRGLVALITKNDELPITMEEHWTEPLHTACEWSRDCPRYAGGVKIQCELCGANAAQKMTQLSAKHWWEARINELNKKE